MNLYNIATSVKILSLFVVLSACQAPYLNKVKKPALSLFKNERQSGKAVFAVDHNAEEIDEKKLVDILDGSLANGNLGSDFSGVIKSALEKDPLIISAKQNVEAKQSSINVVEAQKDFQFSSTIYGGIEDITDNTKGVALALNASRLIFDGGLLNAQIASKRYSATAANLAFESTLNERAFRLGSIWVELEKYEKLQNKIGDRLAVLDPLIVQLETVAKAGIGDVSKVTAAQRTVSAIRVTETNVAEGLARARLDFLNAFGDLPINVSYDYDFISGLIPKSITDDLIQRSPTILSQYAEYQASVANLATIKAKDNFNVGLEARAMRPFAGSGYDSDESVGFVASKKLFNGEMLASEIKEAEAIVKASIEKIKATYREGSRAARTAQQNIESMNKAIAVSKQNAELTADEIIYLKQQLIIGESTLDSVLSAEARLYEAESKEIEFLAEKQKSELAIISALGLLASSVGYK